MNFQQYVNMIYIINKLVALSIINKKNYTYNSGDYYYFYRLTECETLVNHISVLGYFPFVEKRESHSKQCLDFYHSYRVRVT